MPDLDTDWDDASVFAAVQLLLQHGAHVSESEGSTGACCGTSASGRQSDGPLDTLAWARKRFAAAKHASHTGGDIAAASALLSLVLQHTRKLGLASSAENGGVKGHHIHGPDHAAAVATEMCGVGQRRSIAHPCNGRLGASSSPPSLAGKEGGTALAPCDGSGGAGAGCWGRQPAVDALAIMRHVLKYPREAQRRVVLANGHCATALLTAAAGELAGG
jgi:hypothetical protein